VSEVGERTLFAGPLAAPALALIVVGFWKRRPAVLFAGALLLGLALRLVDRPKETVPLHGGATPSTS
jgi:hypothetical protein